ncbi:MAG: UbiX family flavin prenyltransferase [Acidobacteria bacterium]|jgi:4-hydroxy-3-polyprenylbenzoate decarboxylase|nr:UbiX family flavin prenyltransferase [Acidobacteriota bacterium]
MAERARRDMAKDTRRLVVGISGASGSLYGIRLLERLRDDPSVETHLAISASGKRTLVEETTWSVKEVEALADVVYDNRDVGASLASGSFHTAGMIVAPCSIKTLAALAGCHADTLIARAGDVTLKEGRPLLALVRETPLHVGHLRQMLAFAEMGGIVFPPVPAFYQKPTTVEEIVDHTVARALERVGLGWEPVPEWTGGGRTPPRG